MMISGLTCDFESIKLMLPAGLTLGCESVDCGDEKSGEVITGTNSLPLGIGRGDTMLVHFTKRGFKGSKGDTSLAVSLEGAITAPIVSGGVPACVPFL
jgi:hypothetical protein